jgi:hypothetical protein
MKMNFIVYVMNRYSTNRDGVAINCRLDGQGFESHVRQEILSFLKQSRSVLACTKPPNQLGPCRVVKLNTPTSADV